MKKVIFILTLLIVFCNKLHSQVVIDQENFNSGFGSFNVVSGTGDNNWVANNVYAGGLFGLIAATPAQPAAIVGSPNSGYLHITNSSVCSNFSICNANYDTSATSNVQITTLAPIVTTGYAGVSLSFWYLSAGLAGDAFGTVEYQIGSGNPWIPVGGQLQGVAAWTKLVLTNPAFDNQTQLRFRFRWENANGAGADPAFSIDDVIVFAPLVPTKVKLFSVAQPIATFYDTLKEAFDAINLGTYTGVVSIELYGDTTESIRAVLNASASGLANYSSVSIKPIGGVRTVSGILATELISLNGADNVTIDGDITGTKSLTFSNTSTSNVSGTSTIRFQGDATSNLITNCNILGSSTTTLGTNGGNIWFGGNAITTGNDNNTVTNCNVGPAGANTPSKGVYFSGTQTPITLNNSGNTITNNNFIDIFNGPSSSAGIHVTAGSTANTFTNNKFYQTTSKTFTSANTHYGISVNNTTNGENFTITGNTIGFANGSLTGTYTINGNSLNTKFYGIYFNGLTGGTNSTISNNTIANISLTGGISNGAGNTNPFSAIYIEKGLVASNDNNVGSQTSTSSLTFSTNTTTATDVFGIFNNSVDNWVTNNNNVGGVTATNAAVIGAFIVYGMRSSTGIAKTCSATNNLIGGTIANSIQNNSIAPTSQLIGLMTNSSALTATSNTIRNLTTNSTNTNGTTTASLIGVLVNNSGSSHTLSKNNINNLSNTNTTAQTTVNGIVFSGNIGAGTTNTVEKNQIYGLTSATNNALAQVNGILASSGNTTYKNNFITIGAGITNAILVSGINEFLGTNNFWHNSIYIGGSPTTGSARSFAFNASQVSNTRSFRNNIFCNARNNSGTATGNNYIVRVGGTTINPAGLTVNNNVYFGTGTGSVFGIFNNLDVASLSAWQTAVGQDASSLVVNPSFIDPTNIVPDLHIPSSTCSNLRPTSTFIAINDDIDDNIRSTTSPNIGADENGLPTFTWTGIWSPAGTPDLNSIVNFNSSYDMTSLPNIDACSVNINNTGTVVTISSNKYLNIENNLVINNGAVLNILDQGSLVMINPLGTVTNNGSGIANLTRTTPSMQKFDFTYWSSPMLSDNLGTRFANWSTNAMYNFTTQNFADLFSGPSIPQIAGTPDSFDDDGNDWAIISSPPTTTMNPAVGYAIMTLNTGIFPRTETVTFTGKVNTGNQTFPLKLSANNASNVDDFNLVGNPYPSSIFAKDFIDNNLPNISGSIYFWTHIGNLEPALTNAGPNASNYNSNDYAMYNLTGAVGVGSPSGSGSTTPDGYIGAGQGFFVESETNVNNLIFTNSMRSKTYSNSQFFRNNSNATSKDRIWLNFENIDHMFSQQLIGYLPETSLLYDIAYDGLANKTPNYVNFYSFINNDKSMPYKIQSRGNFNEFDQIPLGFSSAVSGQTTISIDKLEGIFESKNIYLQDNLLNITHDLKQSPYNFTTNYGTYNDRFVLKYNNASLANSTFVDDKNTISLIFKDSKMTVSSINKNIESIEIFDVLGRNLYDNKTVKSKIILIENLFTTNQTLIIKTKLTSGKLFTNKVLL